MTARERLLAVLKKEKVDRLPASPDFHFLFPMKAGGYTAWDIGGPDPIFPRWKARLNAFRKFGLDAWIGVGVGIGNTGIEIEQEILHQDTETIKVAYTYHTGKGDLKRVVVYPKYDGEWETKHLFAEEDIADLLDKGDALLDYNPRESYSFAKFKEVSEETGEDGLIWVWGGHPAINWWLENRGISEGIMDIHDHYDRLKPLWDKYESLELEKVEIACDSGTELIYGCGSFTSLSVISLQWFNEFVFPFLKKVTAVCHRKGVLYCTQVNGKCNEILDLLAKAGVDCTEPLERPPLGNVNIGDAKKRIGKTVCLKGNVDPVNTLLKGTPEDVDREVREVIEAAGGDGTGLIVSTSDQTARDTPVENMEAFRKAVEKYGFR